MTNSITSPIAGYNVRTTIPHRAFRPISFLLALTTAIMLPIQGHSHRFQQQQLLWPFYTIQVLMSHFQHSPYTPSRLLYIMEVANLLAHSLPLLISQSSHFPLTWESFAMQQYMQIQASVRSKIQLFEGTTSGRCCKNHRRSSTHGDKLSTLNCLELLKEWFGKPHKLAYPSFARNTKPHKQPY